MAFVFEGWFGYFWFCNTLLSGFISGWFRKHRYHRYSPTNLKLVVYPRMFTSIIMLGWVLPCTTKNAEKTWETLILGTSSLTKIQHLQSSKKSRYRVDIITRRSLLPPNMSSRSSFKEELRIYMYFLHRFNALPGRQRRTWTSGQVPGRKWPNAARLLDLSVPEVPGKLRRTSSDIWTTNVSNWHFPIFFHHGFWTNEMQTSGNQCNWPSNFGFDSHSWLVVVLQC